LAVAAVAGGIHETIPLGFRSGRPAGSRRSPSRPCPRAGLRLSGDPDGKLYELIVERSS